MVLRIKRKIRDGRTELLLITGVTPRTKIKTLERRFKGEIGSIDLKNKTIIIRRVFRR